MPLTPADVANVAFSKPWLGKRCYDEDQVNAFLDVVGADLARWIQDNQVFVIRLRSSVWRGSIPFLTLGRWSHLGW